MAGPNPSASFPDFIPFMDWYGTWGGTVGWPTDRGPCSQQDIPGRPGESYGGIWASPGLFELKDDVWGQPYFTHERNHWDFDYDTWKPRGKASPYHWALWKRDRLVALEAQVEGRVTLLDRKCAGRELLLNFRTEAGGCIRAELIKGVNVAHKAESSPIEGYSFSECDPLCGDSLSRPVTWRGKGGLSALKDQNVLVRLHLVKASAFAYAI